MKFPSVPGRTTDGRRVHLPVDFEGEQTLVVLSFHQRQQSLVDSWRGFANRLREEYDHFGYYELFVSGGNSGMLPPTAMGGLSPSNARRRLDDNTVFVPVDKNAFQRRLGIVGEQTIYAFLVEDDEVVRQAAGVLTSSTAEALESLLSEYESAQNRWSEIGSDTAEESSGG
ncbi:hypothetical protein C499_18834 [Halogeometricum borinquense DSM 11551]|uniref:Peroxiredoxin n=2 Tax=Halogeometricum borinquense TaxID=60847 RepID=E4NNE4_HALBP|nr:hypothetical protein [Halogeometricum borinquense]ADQ67482.1 hypothetical protein Hbor_19150 [Halogeometricum borinquense DSM 11551]ELY23836.1 hypothetical protein C499_18834 [Halogeometricum borinquense DSM 11551]RYJ13543.1 hypothetical protein ELS19_05930 [Halogeometricum borinquense]